MQQGMRDSPWKIRTKLCEIRLARAVHVAFQPSFEDCHEQSGSTGGIFLAVLGL